MTLIISDSRRACLKMAHLVTPSPSLRSAGAINSTVDDNDDLRKFHDDEIVAKNRMIIRKLDSSHITVSHLLCSGTPQKLIAWGFAAGFAAGY